MCIFHEHTKILEYCYRWYSAIPHAYRKETIWRAHHIYTRTYMHTYVCVITIVWCFAHYVRYVTIMCPDLSDIPSQSIGMAHFVYSNPALPFTPLKHFSVTNNWWDWIAVSHRTKQSNGNKWLSDPPANWVCEHIFSLAVGASICLVTVWAVFCCQVIYFKTYIE